MKTALVRLMIVVTFLCFPVTAQAKGVILNFNEVDISTMVKFISDLTGRNFIMDERVKGKISVYSPAKLTNDEAFNVFTSVLELKGFTVVPSGKVNKIVPTSSAKQSGMKVLDENERLPVNDSYVARVIQLDNITAGEAVPFLQPVVSKDGYLSAFGPGNLLLVVDSALNIQKILGLVSQIDTEQQRGGAELVYLKNAGAENIANVVRDWIGSRDKTAKPSGQPPLGGAVIADTRLNALLIFGSDSLKEDVKRLAALIDVVPPTSSSKVNVHYLEHADATEVAKLLDGVVKGMSVAAAPGQPAAAPQQSPFDGGRITITPDKATNALVIMASPTDYQNLLQVIQKIDKRRRQVFVQAVIAEVSYDRLNELGVEWSAMGAGASGSASAVGLFNPFNAFAPVLAALSAIKEGGGISFDNVDGSNFNFAVVLKALQSNGALNVLSTPNILTSDNKEAEIFVGENVPFLTQTNLTTGGVSQQSVERKDTGITLRITPQVNDGEYIKLDLYQEISAVKNFKGQATDLVTTKRSAKTSVVVKDMETVAIGGLIQDQDIESVSKVPLLGDIPGLGWLFKSKSLTRTKTNLMILLTPRIIRDAKDLSATTGEQRKIFGEPLEKDSHLRVQQELGIKP